MLKVDARLCFLTGMQIIYVAFWTELGRVHFAADTMTTPAWGTAGAESQARYILHDICWTACHILMRHELNAPFLQHLCLLHVCKFGPA